MKSSDQRRRRKRILRQPESSVLQLLPVRSLLLCFTFLTFLYLFSCTLPFNSSAFRDSGLSLFSSSTAESLQDFGTFSMPLEIDEDRVLFPDHVLLLVSGGKRDDLIKKGGVDELECVYLGKNESAVKRVVSLDEYDEFSIVVRCPHSYGNYSDKVNLKWHSKNEMFGEVKDHSHSSWDNVVYAAAVNGSTVIVFAKGLGLRAGRASDPRQFSCHFGLGMSGKSTRYLIRTKALSAAQEVVRCALPQQFQGKAGAEGIRVTIGVQHEVHRHMLMPSVAKLSNTAPVGNYQHQLCVCTMVWNQGSAMREWIMYHAWLGIERWFIYDNNSDDGTGEIIQELDNNNYNVSRHVWPWIKTQEAGFSHCALRAKDECTWIAFMDVDEYFYFPYSNPRKRQRFRKSGYADQNSLLTLVANISSSSPTIAEIRTSCHSFGPSGLSSPPRQGVTVGYTCRLQRPERHKSMIRPDALDSTLLNVVHHFRLKKGFKFMNLPGRTAVINHYKYQVWEVFRQKFYRRVATYVADWHENQNQGSRDRVPGLGTEAIEPPNWPHKFCEVWDTGLRDFVLANLADFPTGLLPWEGPATLTHQ